MKVLIADDDRDITAAISLMVGKLGHEAIVAHDGEAALAAYEGEAPDMAILDVMMPGMNGFDVCQAIRERSESVPIMLLTARGDIVDKSVGFRSGADDYVVKPFDIEELALRIKAMLRRSAIAAASAPKLSEIRYRSLSIDLARCCVTVGGDEVELTPKEFQLLRALASSPGEVFSKDRLNREVWGEGYEGEINGLTVLVHRLREKLEADPTRPEYIKTVWNVGYKFGD